MADWDLALALLERFERGERMLPADATKMVSAVFSACGSPVVDSGFMESERGVDLYIETTLSGRPQRLGVEVKYSRGPADEASVRQLLALRSFDHFDRSLIVSRAGFTPAALRLATANEVGMLDLLAPADLRNWLAKHAPQQAPDQSVDHVIRASMKALALRIAQVPAELASLEWRDLERVLREVFDGLGFDTRLTRSGKDGGFDLELIQVRNGEKSTYLIEVKHWTAQKPGLAHLKKLVQVTASRRASAGVLLSTSGFASTVYAGLAEISAPVRLGDGEKVVSLCKAYYRLDSAIWVEATDLESTLFDGTVSAGRQGPAA